MTIHPWHFYSDRHYIPNAHRRKRPIRYLSGAVTGRKRDDLRAAKTIFLVPLLTFLLGVASCSVWHGFR